MVTSLLLASSLLMHANVGARFVVAGDAQVLDRPTTLPAPRPPVAYPPVLRPSRPIYRPVSRPNYAYGRGFAGRVRCESRRGDHERCYARTQGRAVLVREYGGDCRRGSTWGYGSNRIWVARGCRGSFAYGYGSYYPNRWDDDDRDGSDAALIIGGVAVAAGLLAILSKSGKSAGAKAGPPASISANYDWVEEQARPALRQCLDRAARDVGATGGTRIELQDAAAPESTARPIRSAPA